MIPVRRAPSAFLLRAGGDPGSGGQGPGRPLHLRSSHFQTSSSSQLLLPLCAFGQQRKTSLPRGREIPIPHALRSVILFYAPKVFLVIFAKCQTSNYYFGIDSPRTALCTPSVEKWNHKDLKGGSQAGKMKPDTILCLCCFGLKTIFLY